MPENRLTGKKILVTGGAGFIGSNLCEHFLKDNTVVCLDDLSTGFKDNIQHLLGNDKFTFIQGDICDLETCKNALKGVDMVFHQAALGSIPRSINNPIKTNEVNVGGFLNMLVASKEEGVDRFVFAASSSTYGDHQGLPKVEDKIGQPLSPYAVTKYTNELYGKVFADLYGLEVIGLRYFNVFGKNQTPDGPYAAVIPKFIAAFIEHKPPTINGDGEQSRDFTFIQNVIHANEMAALTGHEHAKGEIYNVAYGDRCTVNELVEILKRELCSFDEKIRSLEVTYGPERPGDVKHSLADISKARECLGYDPQFNLNDGIKEAIQWYWNSLAPDLAKKQ
ncbi:MAG: SDR family oxidoreductase [Flavobacteriales bacterium]|nr:SDR family oxidoreductase [Flavobacteriales bacterium]